MLRERCSELQVGPDDLIHIIGPVDRQSPPDCLLRRLWCQKRLPSIVCVRRMSLADTACLDAPAARCGSASQTLNNTSSALQHLTCA